MNVLDAFRRKTGRLVSALRATRQEEGGRAAAALALRKATQAGVRVGAYAGEYLVDLRHGMRTRGFVANQDELSRRAMHGDSHHYQAISMKGFRRCLSAAAVDPTPTAFVDLGAGRGRAVVFAAQAGFAQVVGVELDPVLVDQARANVHRWEARRRRSGAAVPAIEIRHCDAAETVFPSSPVLVWLYNSFGPETLRAVLDRLLDSYRSAPRPITLCYFNAVHADVVAEFAVLTCRVHGDGWSIYTVG